MRLISGGGQGGGHFEELGAPLASGSPTRAETQEADCVEEDSEGKNEVGGNGNQEGRVPGVGRAIIQKDEQGHRSRWTDDEKCANDQKWNRPEGASFSGFRCSYQEKDGGGECCNEEEANFDFLVHERALLAIRLPAVTEKRDVL